MNRIYGCIVTVILGVMPFSVFCPTSTIAQTTNSEQQGQQEQLTGLANALNRQLSEKTKANYNENNRTVWQRILDECHPENVTPGCAQAAIVETTIQCSVGARFFRKDARKWQWINFSLIIASGIFTGLGASSIGGAKAFAALGGTTGLGAATTTVNANATGDQNGVIAVNTTLQNFLKFVQSGGKDNAPADDKTVFKSAPIYAAECSAAVNSSAGGAGK